MTKHLVIVESPAKSKTLKKYLGKDYEILASYGHVRDLLPKKGSVDPENDFAMVYEAVERNIKHVDAIKKALKKADSLLLATDPDREGEAIAWHLKAMLEDAGKLKNKTVQRIVFHEITKSAIVNAANNPRDIDMDMVHAQQARRALDYLVGFNLSPLLWTKIRRGLSAGRVQSPALRLIVERELEIEAFVAKEYWTVLADCEQDKQSFSAKLADLDKAKLDQFDLNNETQVTDIVEKLKAAANGKLTVTDVQKKQRKRNPAAPFITSTLQQEASRKLGFTAQRTMRTAQTLYEAGLISYMRTDSVNLSQDALDNIRQYISETYGKDNCPAEPRVFKTKSKNAQEAHEAIRPTDVFSAPDKVRGSLESDQLKLYTLIWKRAVACQMIHATIDTVAVDLTAGLGDRFRATGSMIAIPGFMSVYQESFDDEKVKGKEENNLLPDMKVGDKITVNDITGEQHFTEPPPRYGEASLVKALEEYGIGRPSTYASIISTLQLREYVILDKKRFYPTDTGRVVAKFLTQYFNQYVDYGFTAGLEDELDGVARGEKKWIPLMKAFWKPFIKLIGEIGKSVDKKDVTQEAIDEKCPKCEGPLAIRLGRNGRFIGCTKYPDCDYTRNLESDTPDETDEALEERSCPKCQGGLVYKNGPYGKFIGCSNYPDCRFIESLNKPKDLQIPCPMCMKGSILQRKSRKGKIFYSCSEYPKCDYALWNEPVDKICPKCKWPLLTKKISKRSGSKIICPKEGCGHSEDLDE
jgi:DNA topoisomerase I